MGGHGQGEEVTSCTIDKEQSVDTRLPGSPLSLPSIGRPWSQDTSRPVSAPGPKVLYQDLIATIGLGNFLQSTVAQQESCTALDLAENDLGDDGAHVFREVLAGCQHLCRVNLSRTGISCGGFASIGEFAESCPSLEVLVMAGNPIGHLPVSFHRGVQLAPALRSLDLSNCGIGSDMLRPLCDALCARPIEAGLERLNMSYNHVETAGLDQILRLLGDNSKLRTLELSACRIGPKGVDTISNRIAKAPAMRRLRVDRNDLGLRGCRALLRLWNGDSPQLDLLDLQENGVTEAGCRELCDLLGKAHSATVEFHGGRQVLMSWRTPQGKVVRKTWNGMEASNIFWGNS